MIRELNGKKKLYGEDMMRGLYGKGTTCEETV